jgi:hypothetical protein
VKRPSKEYILQEIRRCAVENGGVALGLERFAEATGIREPHWSGRYWARWGDAVREAGYEPNTLQGRVLDDDDLVRFLVVITQELGHFPTMPELRMRRLSNPDFPSHNVFTTRLGKRDEQIALVARFAADHDEFASVREIAGPAQEIWQADQSNDDQTAGTQSGYVYLIRSGLYHKIGRTNHLGRRSREIALQLPEKAELVHIIETDDAIGIERYWHERFASHRANGEWFSLTSADIAVFKRRTKFM